MASKKLVIVHGEKGGLGRSLTARLLVSYLHMAAGLTVESGAVSVFDADGNGRGAQLTRTLPGTRPVDLVDPLSSAAVLDTLMAPTGRVAVLDLGARQHRELTNWLYAADAGALVQEGLLEISVVWLIGGTMDSVSMLSDCLDSFSEYSLVVVRNQFFGPDFPALDNASALLARLRGRTAPMFDLPVLAPGIVHIIDNVAAPLHQITLPVEAGGPRFEQIGFTVQRVLGAWMGDVFSHLDDPAVAPMLAPTHETGELEAGSARPRHGDLARQPVAG